tara:strand:+ start:280 stop:474 length:195 start_codon:yes stop_codon:yes gene_type:complete
MGTQPSENPRPKEVVPVSDGATENREKPVPKRYPLQHLDEAPLITRKIYLAKKVSVFPTKQDLK